MRIIFKRSCTDDENYEMVSLDGESEEIATLLDSVPALLTERMAQALLSFAQMQDDTKEV